MHLPIQGITSKISMLLLYNFSITTNITIFTQNEGNYIAIYARLSFRRPYGRKNLNNRK